jgi:hypothetical protein
VSNDYSTLVTQSFDTCQKFPAPSFHYLHKGIRHPRLALPETGAEAFAGAVFKKPGGRLLARVGYLQYLCL